MCVCVCVPSLLLLQSYIKHPSQGNLHTHTRTHISKQVHVYCTHPYKNPPIAVHMVCKNYSPPQPRALYQTTIELQLMLSNYKYAPTCRCTEAVITMGLSTAPSLSSCTMQGAQLQIITKAYGLIVFPQHRKDSICIHSR